MITSADTAVRNRPLDALCRDLSAGELLRACAALDRFRRTCDNLYQRVRGLFFLSEIYRYHLPPKLPAGSRGRVPVRGLQPLSESPLRGGDRRFSGRGRRRDAMSDGIASALAAAYHALAFQTLADQVRRSVRSRARQPVDVPHGASRRPSAARSAGR